MNDERLDRLFSSYLDGELTEAERRLVEHEIRRPGSSAVLRIQELRRTAQILADLPRSSVPSGFARELMERVYREAGAPPDEISASLLQQLLDDPELYLSAYADGELSDRERREVEDYLLIWEDHRATLDAIRRVKGVVADLPVESLSGEQREAILKRLVDESGGDEDVEWDDAPLSDESGRPSKRPFKELLSAYLDGEVDERRRKRVERRLKSSPRVRLALKRYARVRALLRELPRHRAPAGLLDCVLTAIHEEQASPRSEPVKVMAVADNDDVGYFADLPPRCRPVRRDRYAVYRLFGYGAVAAAVVVAMLMVDVPALLRPSPVAPVEIVKILTPLPVDRTPAPARPVNRPPTELASSPAVARPTAPDSKPATSVEAVVKSQDGQNLDRPGLNLPVERLSRLRPGEILELDGQQISLLCLDVQKTYTQLRVVLMTHAVSSQPEEGSLAEAEVSPNTYMVEVAASAETLGKVFADLGWREQLTDEQLITAVDFSEPEEWPRLATGKRAGPTKVDGVLGAESGKTLATLARTDKKKRTPATKTRVSEDSVPPVAQKKSEPQLPKVATTIAPLPPVNSSPEPALPMARPMRVLFVLKPAGTSTPARGATENG